MYTHNMIQNLTKGKSSPACSDEYHERNIHTNETDMDLNTDSEKNVYFSSNRIFLLFCLKFPFDKRCVSQMTNRNIGYIKCLLCAKTLLPLRSKKQEVF